MFTENYTESLKCTEPPTPMRSSHLHTHPHTLLASNLLTREKPSTSNVYLPLALQRPLRHRWTSPEPFGRHCSFLSSRDTRDLDQATRRTLPAIQLYQGLRQCKGSCSIAGSLCRLPKVSTTAGIVHVQWVLETNRLCSVPAYVSCPCAHRPASRYTCPNPMMSASTHPKFTRLLQPIRYAPTWPSLTSAPHPSPKFYSIHQHALHILESSVTSHVLESGVTLAIVTGRVI